MWTFADNEKAMMTERWFLCNVGIWPLSSSVLNQKQVRDSVYQRAVEGSEFHIRAVSHLAFCKLLNISAFPTE